MKNDKIYATKEDKGKEIAICKICGQELKYNEDFEASYCEKCDVWAEECKDDCCDLCSNRPEKPSAVT